MQLNGISKLSESSFSSHSVPPAFENAPSPEERPPRFPSADSGEPKTGRPGQRIPVPQISAVCFKLFQKSFANFNILCLRIVILPDVECFHR